MIREGNITVMTYGGLEVKGVAKKGKKPKGPVPDTGSGDQPPPKPK